MGCGGSKATTEKPAEEPKQEEQPAAEAAQGEQPAAEGEQPAEGQQAEGQAE